MQFGSSDPLGYLCELEGASSARKREGKIVISVFGERRRHLFSLAFGEEAAVAIGAEESAKID